LSRDQMSRARLQRYTPELELVSDDPWLRWSESYG